MTRRKSGPVFAIPCFMVQVRGERGCSMFHTEEAAAEQVACYLSSRPHGVVDISYSEQCAQCRGWGRKGSRPCPACKGKPELVPETLIQTRVAS